MSAAFRVGDSLHVGLSGPPLILCSETGIPIKEIKVEDCPRDYFGFEYHQLIHITSSVQARK
jgi:hypothetical protein